MCGQSVPDALTQVHLQVHLGTLANIYPPTWLPCLCSLPLQSCRYAQTGPNNWPAQLQICGNPPGSSNCGSTTYNASGPFLDPVSVVYDSVKNEYTGGWGALRAGRYQRLADIQADQVAPAIKPTTKQKQARAHIDAPPSRSCTLPPPLPLCSHVHLPGGRRLELVAAHHLPM